MCKVKIVGLEEEDRKLVLEFGMLALGVGGERAH